MYRLLIVAQNPEIEKMFTSMSAWESMGFKQPRVRTTSEAALECMTKHHIDAIAIEDDLTFEPVVAYLDQKKPSMPIFQITSNADKQLAVINELSQLLTQMRADHSNDDYGEEYYFQLARERWMKSLISGMEPTKEQILSHHRLFRCMEKINAPCVYTRLAIPSGDVFLSGRWHYGSERLEIALRNFFGSEHDEMTVHVAVFSSEEVRVLVCPKDDNKEHFGASNVLGFIEETLDQIEQYLGLKMNVLDIRKLDSITAFAPNQN